MLLVGAPRDLKTWTMLIRVLSTMSDYRKLQRRLLSKWEAIPIEVEPLAVNRVLSKLRALGSTHPKLREGQMVKAGPIKTDQDNFIIDAPFRALVLPSDIADPTGNGVGKGEGEGGVWEVKHLALAIKALEGVLSVGIFSGLNGFQAAGTGDGTGGQKPVAAFFGMADGSVSVRNTNSRGQVTLENDKN